MARITFCPHHILDIDPNLEPKVIEAYYVLPLVDFINAVKKSGLRVSVSQLLVEIFDQMHPWSLCEDAKWSRWIADWYGVLKPLLDDMEIINHPNNSVAGVVRCSGISIVVNNIFCDFLDFIATHSFHDHTNEEAVYVPTPWCKNYNDFVNIKSPHDIKFAKYTWYKIYPVDLPCSGVFPFVPPTNWRGNPNPSRAGAPNYGYLDSRRREWHWDKYHDDHWDVQNPGGRKDDYTNVTPEGNILREQ